MSNIEKIEDTYKGTFLIEILYSTELYNLFNENNTSTIYIRFIIKLLSN